MPSRRTFFLLIVLCVGHVLLISAQVQSKRGVPIIEAAAFGAFARFQAMTTGTGDAVRSVWNGYFALRGAARENQDLRQRLLELDAQLQQSRAQALQARSLEAALKLQQTIAAPTLAARVIAGNPQPGTMLTVTIDRGTDDGVHPEMAVITSGGVVGRIIGPSNPRASRVQLLIDRDAAAGATLERTGQTGIVVGGAKDPPLRLEYVSTAVDVQAGERVVTSGQDGIYPKGYLLGTTELAAKKGPQRDIGVRPAVDFSKLDVVIVLLARPPQDIGSR